MSLVSFPLLDALSGTRPLSLALRLLPRPAPRARSPQSRRGWNVLSSSRGRFLSAMLEADSCHRLRPTEERRGKGVEGHPALRSRVAWDPYWRSSCPPPPHCGGAAGPRPPLPPSPAGLCNPVAAARPRAGPWGEGRGRLGGGREAATRGAACFVPRAPTAAFPAPGCGDRRGRSGLGVGLEAERREKEAADRGRRPRRSSGQKGWGEHILGRGGA